MFKFIREVFVTLSAEAFSTWWGQLMTAGAISGIGVWIASHTPTLTEYAPFAYYVSFLILLLLTLLIVHLVGLIWFSGTNKATYVIYKMEGGMLSVKDKQNIRNHPQIMNMTLTLAGGGMPVPVLPGEPPTATPPDAAPPQEALPPGLTGFALIQHPPHFIVVYEKPIRNRHMRIERITGAPPIFAGVMFEDNVYSHFNLKLMTMADSEFKISFN